MASAGYSGDSEVDADIQMTMGIAPDSHVLVYDAPNDYTGQTERFYPPCNLSLAGADATVRSG